MKSDLKHHYVVVVLTEMERFLNDLAHATLSDEHEKRRAILEKQIKNIVPSSHTPRHCAQTIDDVEKTQQGSQGDYVPMRSRAWPHLSCLDETETGHENNDSNVDWDFEPKTEEKPDELSFQKPHDGKLAPCLDTRKQFERLRGAYIETLKISPRRRSVSESEASSSNHRKPNAEYIQGINTGTAFDFKSTKEEIFKIRKPNRKGFNVVWCVSSDVHG